MREVDQISEVRTTCDEKLTKTAGYKKEKMIANEMHKLCQEKEESLVNCQKLQLELNSANHEHKLQQTSMESCKTKVKNLEDRCEAYKAKEDKYENNIQELKLQVIIAQSAQSEARLEARRVKKQIESQEESNLRIEIEAIKASLKDVESLSKTEMDQVLCETNKECNELRKQLQQERDHFAKTLALKDQKLCVAEKELEEEKSFTGKLRESLLASQSNCEKFIKSNRKLETITENLAKKFQDMESLYSSDKSQTDALYAKFKNLQSEYAKDQMKIVSRLDLLKTRIMSSQSHSGLAAELLATRKDVVDLQSQLNSSRDTVKERLQHSAFADLEFRLSESERKLQESDDAKLQMAIEMEKMKATIHEQENSYASEVSLHYDDLQKLETLEADNKELKEKLSNLATDTKNYCNTECLSPKTQIGKQRKIIESLEAENIILQMEIKKLSEENGRFCKNEAKKDEKRLLETVINELTIENQKLKLEVDGLTEETKIREQRATADLLKLFSEDEKDKQFNYTEVYARLAEIFANLQSDKKNLEDDYHDVIYRLVNQEERIEQILQNSAEIIPNLEQLIKDRENIKDQCQEKTNEMEKLEKNNKEKDKVIAKLEKIAEDYKKQYMEALNSKEFVDALLIDKKNKLQETEKSCKDYKRQYEKLMKLNEENKKNKDEIERQRTEIEEICEAYKTQCKELSSINEELRIKNFTTDNQYRELVKISDKKDNILEGLKVQKSILEEMNEEYKKNCTELVQEAQETRDKQIAAEKQIEKYKNLYDFNFKRYDKLKVQNKELSDSLKAKDHLIAEFENNEFQLKKSIETLRNQHNERDDQERKLKESNARLLTTVQEVTFKNQSVAENSKKKMAELEKTKNKITNSLASELENATRQRSIAVAELENIKKQKNALAEELQTIKKELEGMKKKQSDSEATKKKFNALSLEFENVKKELENLKKKQSDFEGNKKKLNALTTELGANKKKLNSFTTDLDNSRKIINGLTTDLDKGKAKIASLTADLEGNKNKMNSLKSELETTKKKYDMLVEESSQKEEKAKQLLKGAKDKILSLIDTKKTLEQRLVKNEPVQKDLNRTKEREQKRPRSVESINESKDSDDSKEHLLTKKTKLKKQKQN